jgi:ubiquitin-like protein Pup
MPVPDDRPTLEQIMHSLRMSGESGDILCQHAADEIDRLCEAIRRLAEQDAEVQAAATAAATATDKGEKLKGELDDLLDEIDEVLETNAEDFVRAFVQKGGQ